MKTKKITKIILSLLLLLNIIQINWEEISSNTNTDDNLLIKAFEERKNRIYNVLAWDQLEIEIEKLKDDISKLAIDTQLNTDVKNKLSNDINLLNNKLKEYKEKVYNNPEISKLLEETQKTLKTKNDLVENLNNEIKENELNKEKIDWLISKYSKEQKILEKEKKNEEKSKYILLIIITISLLSLNIILIYLEKKYKISKKRLVYANFFIIFFYISFLIWFFFYVHPELSIFIIFISWYILVINSHLIASFIWSILILKNYKIWDIIKLNEFRWQISKITTIYTKLIPITNEGIFNNKPIIIPNVELLKNTVIKDEFPTTFLYNYEIKYNQSLWLDSIKLVDEIEKNILSKIIKYRLNTLLGNEEIFRTSIWYDNLWKISVKFLWRWDDILNKKLEKEIIWYLEKFIKDHWSKKETKEDDSI